MGSYTYSTSPQEDATIAIRLAQVNAVLEGEGSPLWTAQDVIAHELSTRLSQLAAEQLAAITRTLIPAFLGATPDSRAKALVALGLDESFTPAVEAAQARLGAHAQLTDPPTEPQTITVTAHPAIVSQLVDGGFVTVPTPEPPTEPEGDTTTELPPRAPPAAEEAATEEQQE